MLANITFNTHPVTKYGTIPACKPDMVELLCLKIVSGEFSLADITYHHFGFIDHLLNPFEPDHYFLCILFMHARGSIFP